MAKTLTLKKRLLILPLIAAAGLLALQLTNSIVAHRTNVGVVLPIIENGMLEAHRQELKALVDSQVSGIANSIKNGDSRKTKIAAAIAATDPIRFFSDKSGYFFVYDMDGVRINMPTNKAQNGQNFIAAADPNGVRFIEKLAAAARGGGGFVSYHFEKPGSGIQPKLSYAAPIPNTDFFVGTGIYIDNIEAERLAFTKKIEAENRHLLILAGSLFAVVLLITITVTILLSNSLSKVVQNVVGQMRSTSDEVASASARLSESSQLLADGSSRQAASLEETAASLEELSNMTKGNSENAHKTDSLSQETKSSAEQGVVDVEQMSQAMETIKASSQDIAKIIKTIDEIAFQTNILALNAAVEAARAGEAGMGFAVVAEEVRSLAHRSADAAKETEKQISSAIANIENGAIITEKMASSLNQIAEKARHLNQISSETATAASQQTTGLQQISMAVSEMDKVTQDNAAGAEESAAAASELRAQSEILRDAVLTLSDLVDGHSEQPSAKSPNLSARANFGRRTAVSNRPSALPRVVSTDR